MTQDILALMAARRHVGLRRLLEPGPDQAGLQTLMEAAAQAPDHGRLRPWRFVLVPAQRRAALGQVFVDALLARAPGSDADAQASAREKACYAPCLLVAILIDDPATAIPTEEKLLSLGCAIQNMLLAAQALGLSSGLASGRALAAPGMRRLLGLGPHEQALLFIGVGTAGPGKAPRERPRPGDFFSTL